MRIFLGIAIIPLVVLFDGLGVAPDKRRAAPRPLVVYVFCSRALARRKTDLAFAVTGAIATTATSAAWGLGDPARGCAARACREGWGLGLGSCPPYRRRHQCRRAGRLLARATGHEGC